MSDDEINHANPAGYNKSVEAALDSFERALTQRYKDDLDDFLTVWTPQGEKPADPESDMHQRSDLKFQKAKEAASDWAAEVRALVEPRTTQHATMQDLATLEAAFGDVYDAVTILGEPAQGDERDENPSVGEDDLTYLTNEIATLSNFGSEFSTWSGIAGESYANSFGKHVGHTRRNHRDIAVSLANMYSARTCAIEAVRRNTLTSIRAATNAISKTQDSGAEDLRWAVVNVGGIAAGFISGGASTAISIGALVGQFIDNQDPDQEYTEDIEDVVSKLESKVESASTEGLNPESQISLKLDSLQQDISALPIVELELYDFTGEGDGQSSSPPADGFEVEVDDVYELSEWCFEASRKYEEVIAKVAATDKADGDLKGVYDDVTSGDTKLKDTRDTFLQFLQTTCARYHEAGCRLVDAARIYYDVETDNEQILKALDREPDLNGDQKGSGGSVDDHLGETDRTDLHDDQDTSANDSRMPDKERS